MIPVDQREIARTVFRLAVAHLDELPRAQHAAVFDLGATLLEGAEAENASSCAFHLRTAEDLQRRLFN